MMETLPSQQVIQPFGKINVWRQPDGGKRVRAYVLLERPIESAKAGLAIDGSVSMQGAFGLSGLLGYWLGRRSAENEVAHQAQRMCAYLAHQVDADGRPTAIYWATGSKGGDIEVIGDIAESDALKHGFEGPKHYGSGTQLLPAVRYFAERFKDQVWGMYVFITDGAIDDLDSVKRYTVELAHQIEAGDRHPMKFVLLGVGDKIDEAQMVELDDLETGTSVDLWDHRLADQMRALSEIFSEVVDEHTIVADRAVLRDARGAMVHDYRDTGLPALLEFTLPVGASDAFSLEVESQKFRQMLP